jgi:hypothetical protein
VKMFTARFPGWCGGCGDRITPGDEVGYSSYDDGVVLCGDCLRSEREPSAPEPVCPACFMIHAGECL